MSELEKAAIDVLKSVRAYLPPDGISKDEFINRVIESVDNPEFNAALFTNSREPGEFGDGVTVRKE